MNGSFLPYCGKVSEQNLYMLLDFTRCVEAFVVLPVIKALDDDTAAIMYMLSTTAMK